MAQDASLNGLRSQVLDSIKGRKLGLDVNGNIIGIPGVRFPTDGWNSAGSTLLSSATTFAGYGFSVAGATGSSATTTYTLAAPTPGARKIIFNPTTGQAIIGTSGAGAFICSSGSVTSTYGQITLVGKGAMVDLIGLTTGLWGLITNLAITTVTTGNLVQLV